MTEDQFFEQSVEQAHLDVTIDAIDQYLKDLPARLARTEHAAAYKSFEKTAEEYVFHRPRPIIGVIAEKDPGAESFTFTRIGRYLIAGDENEALVAAFETPIGRKWAQLERLDEDSVFGATITIIDGQVVSLAETNAQRAALRRERISQKKDGSLHDIMDVIDPDQDDIVRVDHDGCLIIEGGPGTGKTVVALQRLAYLMRTNQDYSSRDLNVLVIGPTETYLEYVKGFFPSLGISGVTNESFLSLCIKRIPEKDRAEFNTLREERDGFKLTKNSANILRVIQGCLWPSELRLNIEATIDRGIAGRVPRAIDCDDISIMVSILYEKFLSREISYNQARNTLHQEIQASLIGDGIVQKDKSARSADARREALLDKWLLRIGLFSQQERQKWKALIDSPRGGRYKRALSSVMSDFYQSDIEVAIEIAAESLKIDTDHLRKVLGDLDAPTKQRRNDSFSSDVLEDDETITVNEISFSDYERARSGTPLPAISQIIDRLLPSRDGVRLARQICRGEKKLYEKVLGPAGTALAERLSGEAKNSSTDPRAYVWSDADLPIVAEVMYLLDGNSGRQNYSHVVVDEAQDLTRLQCRVISQYVSRDQLTLVGDMNQATRTGNLETWESLSAEFDVAEPKLMSLLQNYRVPQNIYDYARQYLSENDRIDTPACDVEGGQVSLLKIEPSDALAALLDLVRTLSMQNGRIAVITDTEIFASEVENLGIANVVALTPEESKGLEVDHSVLIQPNRWFKNSGRIRNLMYVTLTRATKSVTIIQHEPDRYGILEPSQLIEA